MATQQALPLPHTPTPALQALAKNWWLMLLRGIAAIAFGVLAFIWPGLTVLTLIMLFAAYALVDGLIALLAAAGERNHGVPTWWLLLVGLLGIAAATITFFWPGVTALVLVTFIGAWAFLHGIFEIIAAIQLHKELDDAWLLGLSGLVSVVFGAAILLMPGAGALALVWIIGAYAILFGVILVVLSLRLRKVGASLAT